MPFPEPVPGLVIRYSYLWAAEHEQGRVEGVKDRPCAVVMAVTSEDGALVVTVLPITHTPPPDPTLTIEIPHETKRRLGLDDQRSWIVLSEANRFTWPGPDLRPGASGVSFGLLPRALFRSVRDKLVHAIEREAARVIARTQ